MVPHPFLSFSYKRNEVIDKNQVLTYPIHSNEYNSFKEPLKLNNFGHFGNDFSLKKDDKKIRVACLGASTTANNLADKDRDYSYPIMLEEKLNQQNDCKAYEVYNCGIGGWQTPDIMINFFLNILPLRPDYIVIYHAYNDLRSYLTDDFELDYSHSTKNLGEELYKIKRAYYFPKITFWHSYEGLKDKCLGTGNVRNDVLKIIQKSQPNINNQFKDLVVEKELIKNIVIVCRHHGIRVILSSFAHYMYSDQPAHYKYREGIKIENILRKDLADEFDLPFVDIDTLIPRDDKYFVDAIHFTPEGMQLMAESFSEAIISEQHNNAV